MKENHRIDNYSRLINSILLCCISSIIVFGCGQESDQENTLDKMDTEEFKKEKIDHKNVIQKYNNRYFAVVRDKGKSYFIDEKGKKLFNKAFESALNFSEGFAAVKINGKWGYINPEGEFFIKPKYLSAKSFSEGLACVAEEKKKVNRYNPNTYPVYGYINKKGEVALSYRYHWSNNFYNGVAKQSDFGAGDKKYFIDKKGNKVNPPEINKQTQYSEGLYAYVVKNKYNRWKTGYIDKDSNIIIAPQFDNGGAFANGVAPVQESGQSTGTVDEKTGAPLYVTGAWGYINTSGNWVIPPKYSNASRFSCVNDCDEIEIKQYEVSKEVYTLNLFSLDHPKGVGSWYLNYKVVINGDTLSDNLNQHVSTKLECEISNEYLGDGLSYPTNGLKFTIQEGKVYDIEILDDLNDSTIISFQAEIEKELHNGVETYFRGTEFYCNNAYLDNKFDSWNSHQVLKGLLACPLSLEGNFFLIVGIAYL